jgi:hypothetical protein
MVKDKQMTETMENQVTTETQGPTTMPTSTIQSYSRNRIRRLKFRKRRLETFRSLQNNHAEDETDGGPKDKNDNTK